MLQILSIIKMAWDMFGQLKSWLAAKRRADAEENRQQREAALDEAQKAKTPQEAFDAQKKFTDNLP